MKLNLQSDKEKGRVRQREQVREIESATEREREIDTQTDAITMVGINKEAIRKIEYDIYIFSPY